MSDSVKLFIVDDSLIFRHIVRQASSHIPQVEIVGSSGDGRQAVEKILELNPDLVTLDLEMPVASGLDVLRLLKQSDCRSRIVMLSSVTQAGAKETIECLNAGALDFVLKPHGDTKEANMKKLVDELSAIVQMIRNGRRATSPPSYPVPQSFTPPQVTSNHSTAAPRSHEFSTNLDMTVVGIGVSTGGPASLKKVIPQLPGNLPVPVLIVQHMPPLFTKSLAQDLNRHSNLFVKEAEQGEAVRAGIVYIAPGGRQMKVVAAGAQRKIELTDDPQENSCRPAVDYLFRSLAEVYGNKALGVIMTGMGSDGFLGSQAIKKNGGKLFTQDEASSVVYGMPRYPAEAGIADAILPLEEIAHKIQRSVKKECLA